MPTPADTRSGFTLAVLAALAFGVLPVIGKRAFAEGLGVASLLAWRFSIASALLCGATLTRRGGLASIPGPRRGALALLGAIYSVNAGCYFLALERIPAAAASFVFYVYPAVVALYGALFLKRRLDRRVLLALSLALLGVALTVGFARGGLDPAGVGLALLAAAVIAGYLVLGEVALEGMPTVPATALVLAGSALACWIGLAAAGRPALPPTPEAWLLILLMGTISTAFSIVATMGAVRRIGAGPTSIVLTLEPAFTAALAARILGEGLAPRQIVGGALILTGVTILRLAPTLRERRLADV